MKLNIKLLKYFTFSLYSIEAMYFLKTSQFKQTTFHLSIATCS